MNKETIQSKIENEYKNMKYGEAYETDIWTTIIITLIVIFICCYLFIINKIKSLKPIWNENKCNPFFMPLSSIINEDEAAKNSNFSKNNMEQCFNNLLDGLATDIKSPLTSIFGIFSNLFKFLSGIFASIMSFILWLFNMIIIFFLKIVDRINKLINANGIIFQKLHNSINHILGICSILYYKFIIIVEMFKQIISIFTLSYLITLVVPAFLATAIMWLLYFAFLLLSYFGLGFIFYPLALTTLILALILTAFAIFVFMLYIILATSATNMNRKFNRL